MQPSAHVPTLLWNRHLDPILVPAPVLNSCSLIWHHCLKYGKSFYEEFPVQFIDTHFCMLQMYRTSFSRSASNSLLIHLTASVPRVPRQLVPKYSWESTRSQKCFYHPQYETAIKSSVIRSIIPTRHPRFIWSALQNMQTILCKQAHRAVI